MTRTARRGPVRHPDQRRAGPQPDARRDGRRRHTARPRHRASAATRPPSTHGCARARSPRCPASAAPPPALLHQYGIHQSATSPTLPWPPSQRLLGAARARLLAERARGHDPRPVTPEPTALHLTADQVLDHDGLDPVQHHRAVLHLAEQLGARLRDARQVTGTAHPHRPLRRPQRHHPHPHPARAHRPLPRPRHHRPAACWNPSPCNAPGSARTRCAPTTCTPPTRPATSSPSTPPTTAPAQPRPPPTAPGTATARTPCNPPPSPTTVLEGRSRGGSPGRDPVAPRTGDRSVRVGTASTLP